ncbi:hypothetical protein [Agreia sp. VKM Ac-1783]|uniref:hypothetical protein n=1 Tax=Agreia sp. VKM Ac-1783 TaxID=1938889 RepID=UPI000A2AB793|nr:hypothetical protein [Agreia sp. VKM Ac-1783]SMQ73738.1 hypothetical protein SAMN06295943_2979 [Agreia sp. VKM Ac-1783]
MPRQARFPLAPRLTRVVSGLARAMRGRADDEGAVPVLGQGVTSNRIWNSADAAGAEQAVWGRSVSEPWGTRPDPPGELVIDVKRDPRTVAGLAALGFGDEARRLADPFRLVVNRSGLFFYSYGDRKVLDLWIRWSTLTGLAPTVVRSTSMFFGPPDGIHAIAVTGVSRDGTEVTFPLIARKPGSGFGAAIDLSSVGAQQELIDRMNRFSTDRPTVSDS